MSSLSPLSRMKDDYVVRRRQSPPRSRARSSSSANRSPARGMHRNGKSGKEDAVFLFFGACYSLRPPLTTADEKGIWRYPMEPCALLQWRCIPQRKMTRRRRSGRWRTDGRAGRLIERVFWFFVSFFFYSDVAPVNRRSFINLPYIAHAPQGCARVRKSPYVWRESVLDPLFFDPPVN